MNQLASTNMNTAHHLHDSSDFDATSDSQFCWLSPPGVCAISLLFLSGPLVPRVFNGALRSVSKTPRRVWLSNADGERLDEAMACVERGGILITCHGGPSVRSAVRAELQAVGFLAGGVTPFGEDRFAARTLALLPEANGTGACSLVLDAARQNQALREAVENPAHLPSLLAETDQARFLFAPPKVQLWGAVNAGKSSLLNALSGSVLAETGAERGLTRDVIEGRLDHQGFVIRLFDAPGMWSGGSTLDAQAQHLAKQWRREADLTIELVPPGAEPTCGAEAWAIFSRADERADAPADRISVKEPATLEGLKDRLVEHFFGRLRRLPAGRRFALHPKLREDLAKPTEAAREWLD